MYPSRYKARKGTRLGQDDHITFHVLLRYCYRLLVGLWIRSFFVDDVVAATSGYSAYGLHRVLEISSCPPTNVNN